MYFMILVWRHLANECEINARKGVRFWRTELANMLPKTSNGLRSKEQCPLILGEF